MPQLILINEAVSPRDYKLASEHDMTFVALHGSP
jgi:hypothetical protein